MAFKAKGKLEKFDTQKGIITAKMHEGAFGSNHEVQIKLDNRFIVDVMDNLGHDLIVSGEQDEQILGTRLGTKTDKSGLQKKGGKQIQEFDIQIVIR